MLTPNLFAYATSELSQDAFLAYVLAWADQTYESDPRHRLARDLIAVLAEAAMQERSKRGKATPSLAVLPPLPAYRTVRVIRQYDNIDVVCFLDPLLDAANPSKVESASAAILIEDKTFTSIHSGQLGRYLKGLDLGGASKPVYPIVYKTGLQAGYTAEQEAGFAAFTRVEMERLLDNYDAARGADGVVQQYRDYLRVLTSSYAEGRAMVPSGKTSADWLAWQGFADELAKALSEHRPHWEYVSNPQGGFVGMWWAFRGVVLAEQSSPEQIERFAGVQVYLQLEQDTLMIRAGRWEGDKLLTNIRWALHDHLRDLLKEAFEAAGYTLNTSGRSGKSARLFKVLPKGGSEGKEVTFLSGTPLSQVASMLESLTSLFVSHSSPLTVQERHLMG